MIVQILVGHSYGGIVTSNAARGAPNVKALVYVAGSSQVSQALWDFEGLAHNP